MTKKFLQIFQDMAKIRLQFRRQYVGTCPSMEVFPLNLQIIAAVFKFVLIFQRIDDIKHTVLQTMFLEKLSNLHSYCLGGFVKNCQG